MALFLRNAKNETIVDIELNVVRDDSYRDENEIYHNTHIELHSVICINTYSKLLIDNLDRKEEIISEFHELSELRGWLWECYFIGRINDAKEYHNVRAIVEDRLKRVAVKFGLSFVTD